MAKRDFHWLTPAVTSYFVGAVGQELLHQSGDGHLGPLDPTSTLAGYGALATLAGGLTEVFMDRPSTFTRIAEGTLTSGLTLLGMSSMHQVDRLIGGKASKFSDTAAGQSLAESNSDYSADAALPSSGSGDSSQDSKDSVSSSHDGTEDTAVPPKAVPRHLKRPAIIKDR